MAAMSRRIDKLNVRREDVRAKVQETGGEMQASANAAKKRVKDTIGQMMQSLQDRQEALLKEIEELTSRKMRLLEDQAERTAQYSVRSTSSAQDNPLLRLRTDEIIDFKPKKEKDLLEMMNSFGEIDGASTYASESCAAGPLIEGPVKVGKSTWLLIKACDLYGKQRKEGGDKVNVEFVQDDVGPDHFTWDLKDMEDGSYKLFVTPESVGNYSVKISISNADGSASEPIAGSPFQIHTQPPFDYTLLGDDQLGQAGTPWKENKEGFLMHPVGVQFDPQSEFVFVADQANHRLQVFEYASKEAVCAFGKKGTGSKNFHSPGYIVIDRESRAIVSDILNHRLQVIHWNKKTRALTQIRTIGCEGKGPGQFQFPRGLCMTPNGMLLVCDSSNNRIQVFDSGNDFAFVREFGDFGVEDGKLDRPIGIAVNSAEEIFVTDDRHRVQVFDPQGAFLRSWGEKGKRNGRFKHPSNIAIDDEDCVFVCDQDNARVQVFKSSGEFVHKWGGYLKKIEPAGDDGEAPADDGENGDDAEWYGLMMPSGLTVSASGTVLVSDFKKHVVFDFSCGPKAFDESKIFDQNRKKADENGEAAGDENAEEN